MSHPSSQMSAASTMIRPKLIFLSTEDVRPYEDASNVTISLRDPVIAEDGFKLVYGIRSFGYNTTVMNISRQQRNNAIDIEITYESPSLQFNSATVAPTPIAPFDLIKSYTIELPDDNYSTAAVLCSAINTEIRKIVDSGWIIEQEALSTIPYNMLPFNIVFSIVNSNRLYINIGQDVNSLTVVGGYKINNVNYAAYQFNSKIKSIVIKPTQDREGLYNLLFTNVQSYSADRPVCLPSFVTGSGLNPPDKIEFIIELASYATYETQTGGLKEDAWTDEDVDVWAPIIWNLKEYGNEQLLDTEQGIYPIDSYKTYQNQPYIAYQVPDIHPLYVDISSTLENFNLTTEGMSKNLLTRQFVVGAENGNNSFYQSWDNPVYYILDSRRISSMEFGFDSQGEKWNFFNLEFTIELIVFEIEDEAALPDFVEPSFVMPSDDALTASLSRYSSSIQNPYPILGSGQSRKMVEVNDIFRRRVKKRTN